MFSHQHRTDHRAGPSNDNGRLAAVRETKTTRPGILAAAAQGMGSVILSYVADRTFIMSRQLTT